MSSEGEESREALEEEVRCLRAQLTTEKKNSEAMEADLRGQLEGALRAAEKISEECDRAVELSERLKALLESEERQPIDRNGLVAEIEAMRRRNSKYSKMNHSCRKMCDELHNTNQRTKDILAELFREQMEKVRQIPFCARPILRAAQTVDTASVESLADALRVCFDTYVNELLARKDSRGRPRE